MIVNLPVNVAKNVMIITFNRDRNHNEIEKYHNVTYNDLI